MEGCLALLYARSLRPFGLQRAVGHHPLSASPISTDYWITQIIFNVAFAQEVGTSKETPVIRTVKFLSLSRTCNFRVFLPVGIVASTAGGAASLQRCCFRFFEKIRCAHCFQSRLKSGPNRKRHLMQRLVKQAFPNEHFFVVRVLTKHF